MVRPDCQSKQSGRSSGRSRSSGRTVWTDSPNSLDIANIFVYLSTMGVFLVAIKE